MAGRQQFPRLGASACVWRGPRVLLIQRAKPPLVGVWSLPGGHVDAGETALDAARRELLEETGVTADLTQLAGLYEVIRHDEAGQVSVHFAIACYAGHWLAGEALAASDALSVRWVLPEEQGGMVFAPNVREAIGQARVLLGL